MLFGEKFTVANASFNRSQPSTVLTKLTLSPSRETARLSTCGYKTNSDLNSRFKLPPNPPPLQHSAVHSAQT